MTITDAFDVLDLIDELGHDAVDDLRTAAESEQMPEIAVAMRKLTAASAEATIAQVLWYLEERGHADPERVLKLLQLCRAGASMGAKEGWLIGPAAQA